MAAFLATRFPEKAPELWAYQTTIVKAAHAYEGSNWVSYDRQFRREMLARKDLNWSIPDAGLYNEAFTGRAKSIPRCPHCLSEDHTAAACQFNPNPPIMGWLQDPSQFFASTASPSQVQGFGRRSICRNYNSERCYLSRCHFSHVCAECQGSHPQLDALRARGAAADPQRGGAENEADKRWGTSTGHTCSQGQSTALRTQALAKIYCNCYSLVMITC